VNVASTVPAFPSVMVGSLTLSVGRASPSVIVPSPRPSAIVPLPAFERLRVNVSSNSSRTSPATVTVTFLVVWPGRKVSDPVACA
jgi:hypothetical protein